MDTASRLEFSADAVPYAAPTTSWIDSVRKTIWLTRPDVRETCRWSSSQFEWWLVLAGLREYPALAEVEWSLPQELLWEPSAKAHADVQPPLTRFMELLWSVRADVQSAYDLDTQEGQQGFVWWYFFRGVGEHGFARFVTGEQRRFLNEPDPAVPSDTLAPITRLMVATWARRPDIQQAFPIDTPAGRASFMVWYFTIGAVEMELTEFIDASQAQALMLPSEAPPIVEMVRAGYLVNNQRLSFMGGSARRWAGKLIRRLNNSRESREADARARDGDRSEAEERYPVLKRLWQLVEPSPAASGDISLPATISSPAVYAAQGRDLPFGVNLIGYAQGQFGIGEDVRMAARAMQVAGIPFAIHNIEPGHEVCQGDRSVDALITRDLPYAINLFCTTGFEMAQQVARLGTALLEGRRNIGYWPWELPEWPEDWHHAYDLVDEIWASSRYTYEAFAKSSPKPVRHMPMAVAVNDTVGAGRRDFDLMEDRFLFVFAFDALSHYMRKNPLACVRAFRRAFPRGDEPVGLVIKAMRTSHAPLRWQALLEETRGDGRITIIARTLDRGELFDLYRACDCFVSLHRSEGFGRNIAEAMMLGKPVIVTGHSGNMDFTTPGTAALVDHRPRRVGKDDYPFGEGLSWAEPDVDHAARWMRRMVADPLLRERLARQGQDLTSKTYAPEAVGAGYAEALARASEAAGLITPAILSPGFSPR